MTPEQEARIRYEARTQHAEAAVNVLLAALDAERAKVSLPVIATCAECKHCTAMGRVGAKIPRRPLTEADLARIVAFYHCEHDDTAPHRDSTGVARVLRDDPPPEPRRVECPACGYDITPTKVSR